MNEATMTDAAILKMQEMAKLENKRLRLIIGNVPSPEKLKEIKRMAAKGGYQSHANGSKRGKNGTQGLIK
jgi:hypothetical protein